MSVRPYSSDRERIQTEWNPHQHGCCAIDLSVCWLTKRKLEERGGRSWGGGLDWTQSLCFCLCIGLPGRHREGERETEGGRERERRQLKPKKWKDVCVALSSPTIHIWNSCRRGQKDANTEIGSFPTSETEWVAGKREENYTDKYGNPDIPGGLLKSRHQSAVNN